MNTISFLEETVSVGGVAGGKHSNTYNQSWFNINEIGVFESEKVYLLKQSDIN